MLLAQSHNPSIINHDFLKDNGIIGEDWSISGHPIITPIVTQIKYEKDIAWQITPDTCGISEKIGIKPHDSLSLYECAKKYVEVLKHIPYIALGINWQVSHALSSDPNEWLKSKFLQSDDLRKEILTAELMFKLQSKNSSVCTLSVKASNEQGANLVIINCNFHFDFQYDTEKVEKILSILENWMDYRKTFESYLNKYFIEKGAVI